MPRWSCERGAPWRPGSGRAETGIRTPEEGVPRASSPDWDGCGMDGGRMKRLGRDGWREASGPERGGDMAAFKSIPR